MEGNDHRGFFPSLIINKSLRLIIHFSRMLQGITKLREKCSEFLERKVSRYLGKQLGGGTPPRVPAPALLLASPPVLGFDTSKMCGVSPTSEGCYEAQKRSTENDFVT